MKILVLVIVVICMLLPGCTTTVPCENVYIEVLNHSKDRLFIIINDGAPVDYGISNYYYMFMPGERRTYKVKPHKNTLIIVYTFDCWSNDNYWMAPKEGLTMEELNTNTDKEVFSYVVGHDNGKESELCIIQLDVTPTTEYSAPAYFKFYQSWPKYILTLTK